MKLGCVDRPCRSDGRDRLARRHLLATADHDPNIVTVGRDPAICVADQDQLALTPPFVAGIGDDTVLGLPARRTASGRHVYAVVGLPPSLRSTSCHLSS